MGLLRKLPIYCIAILFLVPAFLMIWLGVILGVIGLAVGESADE
jgi:membrane protein implicated in regulation of membrane protease activity